MPFTRATRGTVWVKMGIAGPAGAGKTWTALAVASALGEAMDSRVALIDTEGGASATYADGNPFDFDSLKLAEFHPDRYITAIKEAMDGGYKVLVIDSVSHEWYGKGGILELVDRQAGSSGNKFTSWAAGTVQHNKFVEALNKAPIHLICTLRSKVEYAQVEDPNTRRSKIVKLGMAPIQREGLDYEFMVYGDMDIEHNLTITKTRIQPLTDLVLHKPGADLAQHILTWMSAGGTLSPAPTKPSPAQRQPTPAARPAPTRQPAAEPDTEPMEEDGEEYTGWTDEDHRVEHEAGGGGTQADADEAAPADVELLPNRALTVSEMKSFFITHGGDNAAWGKLYTACKGEKDAIRQSVNGHMRLKAHANGANGAAPQDASASASASGPMATDKQMQSIHKLSEVLGKPEPDEPLTYVQAKDLIVALSGDYNRMRNAEIAGEK